MALEHLPPSSPPEGARNNYTYNYMPGDVTSKWIFGSLGLEPNAPRLFIGNVSSPLYYIHRIVHIAGVPLEPTP